jgi:3-oxoacyl-[acyl-carrier protein] reductase
MRTALDGSPSGRVAIVTGGSRGAGLAATGRLAACGCAVVVNYLHDQRAAESAVDAVLAGDGDAVAVRADVADELDVARLFAETTAAFGGVDIVVHAVGGRAPVAAVTDVDVAEFDALMRVSARAAFVVSREAARHVRDHGAIVSLRSSASGSRLRTHGVSMAATAAADVLTRALAFELRERRVTVTAVSLEAGRPCAPDRVAEVIEFLVSDDGRRLTGQVLRVGDQSGPPTAAARVHR